MAPNDVGIYPQSNSFYRTITEALNDVIDNGFDSAERIEYWTRRIRAAALMSMTPPHVLEQTLQATMRAIYQAKVERGGILKFHPGVSKFTLERVKPRLRAELDRRLMASANLIKLNRASAIEKTLQRFSGWATSIPAGGSDAVDKVDTKTDIRKALASLPFEERRVSIDQGHKLVANLNNILAVDGGALAAEWHSHWRQAHYNYRRDHKERDEKIYVIRDNWALSRGLMKTDGHQYTDQITAPGEEVFCRCSYRYLYSLRALPPSMVTDKGRAELERVRVAA